MPAKPRNVEKAEAFRNDLEDPRHGTVNGYSNLGCRCQPCKDANAVYNKRCREQREGRLTPDDPRHGKTSTYTNWRCRCDACRQSFSQSRKKVVVEV